MYKSPNVLSPEVFAVPSYLVDPVSVTVVALGATMCPSNVPGQPRPVGFVPIHGPDSDSRWDHVVKVHAHGAMIVWISDLEEKHQLFPPRSPSAKERAICATVDLRGRSIEELAETKSVWKRVIQPRTAAGDVVGRVVVQVDSNEEQSELAAHFEVLDWKLTDNAVEFVVQGEGQGR